MNNIDIDVNLEDLDSITNFFNEHITSGVEDINNVLSCIETLEVIEETNIKDIFA